MQTHDLPGKTQSDAGAFQLGGIERNKDFFLAFRTDRATIIRYSDHDGFGIVDFRRDFYFVASACRAFFTRLTSTCDNWSASAYNRISSDFSTYEQTAPA